MNFYLRILLKDLSSINLGRLLPMVCVPSLGHLFGYNLGCHPPVIRVQNVCLSPIMLWPHQSSGLLVLL